jgi:hypothetical protein
MTRKFSREDCPICGTLKAKIFQETSSQPFQSIQAVVPSSCVAGSCAKNTMCTPHGVRLALPVPVPPCDTKYWGPHYHVVSSVSAQPPVCLLIVLCTKGRGWWGVRRSSGALTGSPLLSNDARVAPQCLRHHFGRSTRSDRSSAHSTSHLTPK